MDHFESPLVLYVNGKLDLVSASTAIRQWAAGQPDSELEEAADYLDGLYGSHQIGEHVHKKLLQSLYFESQSHDDFEEDGEETVFKKPADIAEDATVIAVPTLEQEIDDDATMLAPDLDEDATVIAPGMSAGNDDETVIATQPGEATRMISEINERLDSEQHVPDEDELGPGSVLKERFNLVSVLGEGGMGRVYKAIDMLKVEAKDSNPYVAIKLLTGDFREHPDAFIALQRETSKAQKLAHPNISTVYDFDRHKETVYMTMELLEGIPLDEFIKRMPEGGLDIEQAISIIQDLGAGLGYAHQQGLVHSDFKPGNAFFLDDGSVKVIDFGIARAASITQDSDAQTGPTAATTPAYTTATDRNGNPSITTTGGNNTTSMTDDVFDAGSLGALTPAYATIEMFEGKAPHPSDDIYALACVAIQLLTGKHPFNKRSAPKARDKKMKPPVVQGLTKRQQRALEKALEFKRSDRTQNMEEFLDGIRKRKSYIKQIAIGTVVTAALITAVGYQPMMNYYEQKEIDELIVRTNEGTDSYVRSTLATIDSYPVDKQFAITSGIRDRAVSIFTDEINAAVDFEREQYDFARADAVIKEALSFYPDSAAVKELDASIKSQRAQQVSLLEQEFYEQLVKKHYYPVESEMDMVDVLAKLNVLDNDNQVLDDPRLEYAYYDNTIDSGKKNDKLRAATFADIGDSYIPSSFLFAELKDQMRITAIKDAAAASVAAASFTDGYTSLEDYRPHIASLATLSLFDTGTPAKNTGFIAAFEASAPDSRTDFIDALPFQSAITLATDDAPQPDTLSSLHIIDDDSDLDSVLTGVGKIKQELARYGNAALAQYNVDYPALTKQLASDKRFSLIKFYNQLYSGLLLGETIAAASTRADETADRVDAYLASLTLRADEENDKRIFRKISSQNRLNDSIQVYNKISKISSDEEFLDFARSEISRMYLTLAETNATESEFKRALNYAENAQKYVADERTQQLIDEYRKEITLEGLPALVVSGTEELKQQAQQQLRYLKKTFPDDYPFFINRIAATINEDIIIRASENLLDAHKLKEHALSIVNSRIIRNVAIKALPEPSKLALQGKIEVSQHKLSAALDTYAKAEAETPGHYQVNELDEVLQAELVVARQHYEDYQKKYRSENYDTADSSLRMAQDAWIDNKDYIKERAFYDRILKQVTAKALLCRTDIQGLGKQSRGICRDRLLVSSMDAPTMVVIPAATTRDAPYAISKYETSIEELNLFCTISGQCEPNTAGNAELPATSVPLDLIGRYAEWLSTETGFTYALASKSEWLNAASAGGREGNSNYNCRLRLGTKMIKGTNIVPVTSGTANNWGLINYVGNADELVKNGDNYELVGGNFTDSISDCKISLTKQVEDNYKLAGFRLVRSLN